MRTRALAAVLIILAMDAKAADSAGKVDAELLEFLGSIDAEETGWQEYLEKKPVKVVEKTAQKKPAPARKEPEPKEVKAK